jgi:peptidoglycan-associated lipoprotein
MSRLTDPIRTGALWLASGLLLAGCASTPLEEAPVSSATSPAPAAATAAPAPAATTVAPVTASTAAPDLNGPQETGRIVYFEYDSAAIRPEFRGILDAHARFLKTHKDRKVTVAGHTDERGGREYNVALGQQRAEAVQRALQLLGAAPSQVETISFGEEKPMAEAHDEGAWSRNRRAELAYR